MKKNIYLIQANPEYGGEIALPYAPGLLAAYALQDEQNEEVYSLAGIYNRKESAAWYINRFDNPFLVGFSCYIWNFEYSKQLALKIKQAFPSCYILFGGHSVENDSSCLLTQLSYVDFLIHAEGEVPFCRLLKALNGKLLLKDVPNLSYRENGEIYKTNNEIFDICDFPSPYLTGVFDSLLEQGGKYYGVFETNRGCPFQCTYCDWGNHGARVRLFSLERVKQELKWFSQHQIDYLVSSDANFGMFARDEEIVNAAIEEKKRTGYPGRIQFCFTKNSDERVFEITKRMHRAGLSKGATLSLQTLAPLALDKIGRSNMSYENYCEAVQKYSRAGIPSYTDIILGLPGETYQSFIGGLGKILQAGQHTGVNVFNCEILVNSVLGQQKSIEDYKIQTARCAVNRHHAELSGDITENNTVIIGTYSMPPDDWKKANLFVGVMGAMHNLGLLRLIALFAYFENHTAYEDFYDAVLRFGLTHPETIFGKAITKLAELFDDVIAQKGICECALLQFGNVNWPIEEWIFLQLQENNTTFYREIFSFLQALLKSPDCFDEMLVYQQNSLKFRGEKNFEYTFSYDFPTYFQGLTVGEKMILEQKKTHISINSTLAQMSPEDYARKIVWYGRKGSDNFYKEEMSVTYL